LWGDAPAEADMVRIEFEGNIVEEPVIDRAYLMIWWRAPAPQDWPRVRAFRIGGRWLDSAGAHAG
jgi:hypothetical protein